MLWLFVHCIIITGLKYADVASCKLIYGYSFNSCYYSKNELYSNSIVNWGTCSEGFYFIY